MAQQLDKNPIPTASSKNDADWRARAEALAQFLLETQKYSPAVQRTALGTALSDLTQESRNAAFEDRLQYQTLINMVRQESEDLENTHPESGKDKTIRLAMTFARATFNTTKPVVVAGAKMAWTGTTWAGRKIWTAAKGEGQKVLDDIAYEAKAIKDDVYESFSDARDEAIYLYHEVEHKLFATAGMAALFGTGALIWNLTHTNPDAAPENRAQLALNDQPETVETILTEEWNPKIAGLDTKTAKTKHKKKSKAPEIDLETITLAANIAADRGISPQYAATVALIESGGNPKAHNPSGAKGVYQFIPSTASNYGLKNPFNAVANTKAFIRFTKDNEDILSGSLGREPSDAEKYIAHQQGAAGATKLLTNPNTPAVDLVGKSAIIQNGGHSGMTAREFTTMWKEKYAQKSALLEIREVK